MLNNQSHLKLLQKKQYFKKSISKRVIQKTADATDDLIGEKILIKLQKNTKNTSETLGSET